MNTAMRRAASDASSRRVAHANRHVEVLADQIDEACGQVDLERDRRILPDELGEHRREHEVGEVARHRHAQPSARLDLPVLGQRRRGRDVLDDVMRMLEHGAAEVGDGELARRAQQQPFAELRFERRHASRHGRLGQAQALGGAGKAAFVDDAGEEQEIVGFEVHGSSAGLRHSALFHQWNNDIHFRGLPPASACATNIVAHQPPNHPMEHNHEHPADQLQRPPRRLALDAPRHPARRAPARCRPRRDASTVRDLSDTPHPVLDEAALRALFTPAEQRTPEQAARVALDDALIAEMQAADVVVLGVPMYNFGVPAQLKNWIDAISRAGVTFRYTANGPEGLLKGKKVYVALTRGGKYRNTPADTQVPYLKTVFTFLGMTDVQFVYAEGLAMGPDAEQTAIASAHEQIEEARGGVTSRVDTQIRLRPGPQIRVEPRKENAMTTTLTQSRPSRRVTTAARGRAR